jgi:hypothetical protein
MALEPNPTMPNPIREFADTDPGALPDEILQTAPPRDAGSVQLVRQVGQ